MKHSLTIFTPTACLAAMLCFSCAVNAYADSDKDSARSITETQVRAGVANDRRVFVQESADHGATWSAAREITSKARPQH